VGVDVVVRAVVENDFEVDDWIAREVTASGGVFYALLHGRNEVFRNRATKDVVYKLELGSAEQRLHLDLAVAVLSVPTRLLLVTALYIGLSANGLTVRHLGNLQVYLGVIALLHLGHGHFDVLLSGAGDQELFRLGVPEEAQHGIFFHELVNADTELVFVGAALRLNGERDGGLGKLNRRELNGRRLIAERVAGQRVLYLCHRAGIARVQFAHRNRGLSLHDRDMSKLLLRVAGEVLY